PINPHLREFHCSFEEEPICMFTQDKNDDFDWTRHSAATRDTKYTPNTGPSTDHTGSKQASTVQKPQGAATMRPQAPREAVYARADPAMDPETRDPGHIIPRQAATGSYCVRPEALHMLGTEVLIPSMFLGNPGPPVMDPSCSSAELDPPLPHLHHLPSNFLPVSSPPLAFTPPPVGSQGEDISNPKPKMSIQAHDILGIHVFLWGPSTKETIIC
ncbi:hypothetical protein ATANTOWER_005827, partial [Ataeniobius toweri]|nr:hypothetical protein [Ataeniobius toweri]